MQVGRQLEAKDAARVALATPWWTLGSSFSEVASIAGWGDEQVEYKRFRVTEEGRQEDLLKGKTPEQVSLFNWIQWMCTPRFVLELQLTTSSQNANGQLLMLSQCRYISFRASPLVAASVSTTPPASIYVFLCFEDVVAVSISAFGENLYDFTLSCKKTC